MQYNYSKIILATFVVIVFQGCSGIYFVIGTVSQKLNDFTEHGFHKPTIEEIESECSQNIFSNVILSFSKNQRSITIKEFNSSVNIETARVKNYDNAFVVRRLDGNTTYSIVADKNRTYFLSDIVGHFNPRCHMFGCEPVCSIKDYKLDAPNSSEIHLIEGDYKIWEK